MRTSLTLKTQLAEDPKGNVKPSFRSPTRYSNANRCIQSPMLFLKNMDKLTKGKEKFNQLEVDKSVDE